MEQTRKRKEVEKEKEIEEKVIRILTGEKLSAIKAMLEKDHAIDCILLSMIGRGQRKHAKEFMKELKLTLPDGTFRARMIEIEDNGLVKHQRIDAKKRRWATTQFGRQVGKLLLELFSRIADGREL